jgi:hypothetical protein
MRSLPLLCALVLAGCTSTAAPSAVDGGGGSPDGAAPADLVGAADSAPSGASAIWPLAAGYTWTYDVTTSGYPACTNGSSTAAVLAAGPMDGRQAFQVSSFCAGFGDSWVSTRGDEVDTDYMSTWIIALGAPVAEGQTWSNGTSTFTWRSAGAVTVPAGTFQDCWKATQNVSYTFEQTYCRGAGLVESVLQDLAGGGWTATLTAKSF